MLSAIASAILPSPNFKVRLPMQHRDLLAELDAPGSPAGGPAILRAPSRLVSQPLRRRAATRLVVPTILLLIYVAQGFWFIRTQSFTFDEPVHLKTGLEAWRSGAFKWANDHPPLGHLLSTLPIIHVNWEISYFLSEHGFRVDSITPDPEAMALRTRSVNLALGVLLGALLWTAARGLFSEGSANLALGLFAFSPSLIAHFCLTTTDGVATLMIFATSVQLMRWRKHPSQAQTLLLGLVLGLLLLAKHSTPPFFVMSLMFMLVAQPGAYCFSWRRWNWRPAAAAACLALLVLWGGYFFHISQITCRRGLVFVKSPHQVPIPLPIILNHNFSAYVPAGEYLLGFWDVAHRNSFGYSRYLLGKFGGGPMPLLQLATIILKWPTIVLLLFGWSVVLLAKGRIRRPENLAILVGFPTLLLGLAMITTIAKGDRHLLPTYPFILLFASATWKLVGGWRQLGRRRRALAALLVLAVFGNAADALRYAPDYLSYFNIFVPPNRAYRLLYDCNLDWGQGLLALRDYQTKHPLEQIHLVYHGSVDPSVYGLKVRTYDPYGLKVRTLAPDQIPSGTVVVGAYTMSVIYSTEPNGYSWLKSYPVKTVLNHSLFVFDIPPRAGP
jgi:hypothetical protein